jgi:hypothetical protein
MVSKMNDLTVHVKEFSCEDGRVETLLNWIINEHIQGRVAFGDMPKEAQCCYGLYEQEKKLMQDADIQAAEWEEKHKADIHNKINFAVKNGQLDYDTAMELINDPDKADEWVNKGLL